MTGETFTDFVRHVRLSHRVGVRTSGEEFFCEDCPSSEDQHRTRLRDPEEVLQHLSDKHGVLGAVRPLPGPPVVGSQLRVIKWFTRK